MTLLVALACAVGAAPALDWGCAFLFMVGAAALHAHVGVATLRRRAWAALLGMTFAAVPGGISIARAVEFLAVGIEGSSPYAEAVRFDAVVFLAAAVYFGILFALHLTLWVRKER